MKKLLFFSMLVALLSIACTPGFASQPKSPPPIIEACTELTMSMMDTNFVMIDSVMGLRCSLSCSKIIVSWPATIQEVSINKKHDTFFDKYKRCKCFDALTSNYRLTPNLDYENFRQLFMATT